MPTIAVVGEVVADAVLPPDGIVDGAAHLTVHPGGGPANFAVAVSRLGTTARFAGRLSTGALGSLCRDKLEASNVDLSASEAASEPATLAIARLDASGAASYEFYTDGTADWAWTDKSLAPLVDGPFPSDERPLAIHTGTLALALQPSGQVIENLLARARAQLTISVDPNLRTLLVPIETYRAVIDRWAGLSDIVRLSEDDLVQLWPGHTPEQAAAHLHDLGVPLVVVSLGADGAFGSLRGESVRVPIAPTDLVDTVGAGDSFHGGMMHHLAVAGHLGGRLDRLDLAGLTEALAFASRVSAINCSRAGANPPWAWELADQR
ncbi:fructokinase [Nakamurella panacisegetis]|uniref:Fructokinase n=1 Tax=Nakamurella panacisegetis TaxID=1090615 RepID=A0A1H0K6Z2_9ACTN|nr:carbohydrate kinase [Nakamurella panacisegetis]SDO51637.1 fructokinase [Nakamurella panacisegetis]